MKRQTVSGSTQSLIFKHLSILVVPMSIARKRQVLFETQISKEGGHVCTLNNVRTGKERPTHIVVEDSCAQDARNLEKALSGLETKDLILVGTRWLSDCIKRRRLLETMLYELKSVSFHHHEHSECPSSKKKLKGALENPLEEAASSSTEVDISKFSCSKSSLVPENIPSANELIIAELQKLADAFRNKGDTWRSHGYSKAISAIKRHGQEIKCYEDAISLEGVGSKIAERVVEILETGLSRKVSEICDDTKAQVLETFTKIWGVGPSTADSWYRQGCRTLKNVEEKIPLTKQQIIGLKYFNDFQEKIPRGEVETIFQLVTKTASTINHSLVTRLVGSYRRGKPSCGDVDILICKPDFLKTKNILSQLISSLKTGGLVTDDLVSLDINGNQRKYLGVCRLPGDDNKFRRLDIFVVPQSEFAPALLHYTGSAMFNRSIRLLAAKRGMSLSEHALHAGVVREGMRVLNEGCIIPTPTEEAIFSALKLDYKQPEERDH